nr:MAG TPA: hypothetical protein [Crassvirales sp.]DAT88509.1 MAG TPA: hypothetical protein [Bacteriophage sp.]
MPKGLSTTLIRFYGLHNEKGFIFKIYLFGGTKIRILVQKTKIHQKIS